MSTAPSTVTTEEARLRVPLASLAGLDPVGLRLWFRDPDDGWWSAMVFGDSPEGIATVDQDGKVSWWEGRSDGHVDFAEASTADRAVRLIARRVGMEVGCTAPQWRIYSGLVETGGDWDQVSRCELFFMKGDRVRASGPVHFFGIPAGVDLSNHDKLLDGSFYSERLSLALAVSGRHESYWKR